MTKTTVDVLKRGRFLYSKWSTFPLVWASLSNRGPSGVHVLSNTRIVGVTQGLRSGLDLFIEFILYLIERPHGFGEPRDVEVADLHFSFSCDLHRRKRSK